MTPFQDTFHKIAAGVATAAFVALGGASVNSMVTNSRQDAELQTFKESSRQIEKLREEMAETNKNLVAVKAELEFARHDRTSSN